MFDKFFVGGDVLSSVNNGKYKPVSRVTLLLDDSNSITAGDDTGHEIVASCPHATQEIVNALLAYLRGHEYQAYEADGANIDPSAELGDGVTVGGVYSVIANIRDDGSGFPSLCASGEAELEGEYPMDGPMTQMFGREIKRVGSLITKTAEEIRTEVRKLEESVNGTLEAYSTIEQTAEMISSEVRKLEESVNGTLEAYSTTKQTAEQISAAVEGLVDGEAVSAAIRIALGELSLSASSSGGTTTLTLLGGETTLSTKELKLTVDAAYITGSLTIGQLPDDVATTDQIPTRVSELANDRGYATETGITTIVAGTVTTDYVNALGITAWRMSASGITAGVLDADLITLDGLLYIQRTDITGTASGYIGANPSKGAVVMAAENLNVACLVNNSAAKLSYFEDKMIWVHSGGCYSSETMQIYSDRRLKNTISYDLSAEEELFGLLRPCSFAYNSDQNGRKHWGFIAQDLIESAGAVGLDAGDLAVLGQYEGRYSIGYGEITALNTYMIQRLMSRVAALESRGEG